MKNIVKLPLIALITISITSCSSSPTNENYGTVIGGVIGGLGGNQIGGGSGKVAATIIGTMLGAYIGGKVGESMDEVDRMKLSRSLETTRNHNSSSWRNPDTNSNYTVTPTKTYYENNYPCRNFTLIGKIDGNKETINGTACRDHNDNWNMK